MMKTVFTETFPKNSGSKTQALTFNDILCENIQLKKQVIFSLLHFTLENNMHSTIGLSVILKICEIHVDLCICHMTQGNNLFYAWLDFIVSLIVCVRNKRLEIKFSCK